jgi:hypothetical protein
MDAAGMVHALKIAYDFLKPDGALINIQPVGQPRPLEIRTDRTVTCVGMVGHRLNFASHHAALEAVAQVLHDGLFVMEEERQFPFLYQAESLSILRAWLAEKMPNSIVDEATARRAHGLSGRVGVDCKATMREEIVISLLRPI